MQQAIYSDDGISIHMVDGRYFIRYDAGAHQIAMREDEITKQQAEAIIDDPSIVEEILFDIQRRLTAEGIDPYQANI